MALIKPLGLYVGEVESLADGDCIAITSGGTGAITKTLAFNNLSPSSVAGDILAFNGTNNIRFPIGTVGQVLTVASFAVASRLVWTTPEVTAAVLKTNVDNLYGAINSGIGNLRGQVLPKLPVPGGTIGQVLAKASDDDYDTEWITPSGGSSGTTINGLLKGNGSNVVLAVPDIDYPSVETVEFVESGFRLGDRKLQEQINTLENKLDIGTPPLPNESPSPSHLVNPAGSYYWKSGLPVTNVEIFPGQYADPSSRLVGKGLTSSGFSEIYGEPTDKALNIKTNGFYGMLKAVAEIGPDPNGIIGGVIQHAVAGVDYALPITSVPAGGSTNQVLTKSSNANYDLEWATPFVGGGSSSVKAYCFKISLGYDFVNDIFINRPTQTQTFTSTDIVGNFIPNTSVPLDPLLNIVNASIGFKNTTDFNPELDKHLDELEFNPLVCYAYVVGGNELTLIVTSTLGIPFSGNYFVNFFIG